MKQKEQVWWVAAAVLSLAAFSFFAGLGLRGLVRSLSGNPAPAENGALRYPQLASAGGGVLEPDIIKPAALYASVLQKLKLYYVEPTPPDTVLAYGSVDYMLNELKDPNTRLLSPVEMEALKSEAAGVYPGLGAVLTIRRYPGRKEEDEIPREEKGGPTGVRTITVVAVAPGGPAEKAGIRAGDRITELDGHWVAPTHISYRLLTQLTDPLGPQDGRPLEEDEKPEKPVPSAERDKARKEADEARARWKNSTDLPSTIQALLQTSGERLLTIERGTPSQTVKIKVTLGSTRVEPVSSRMLEGGAAYLRLQAFNDATPKEAAAVLSGFQDKGARSLVLDLRQNAGGDMDAVASLAGLLIGERKVAVVKERDSNRRLVDRGVFARGTVRFRPQSLAVLVDRGTSGTAELLAAALRDHLGAKLVGSATFGDGTSQDVIRLENGAGISITRARTLTPKGVDFEGKGLQADVPAQGDPMDAALRVVGAKA